MKTKLTLFSTIAIGLIVFALQSFSTKTIGEPWKKEQLMELINDAPYGEKKHTMYCVWQINSASMARK